MAREATRPRYAGVYRSGVPASFAAQRALVTSAMISTSDIALHRAKCRKGPICDIRYRTPQAKNVSYRVRLIDS
jgi:hypothetical protein